MSSPGGSGNWGQNEHATYCDPLTGQPIQGGATSGQSQGYSGMSGPGMQYQGLGTFDQNQQPTPGPGSPPPAQQPPPQYQPGQYEAAHQQPGQYQPPTGQRRRAPMIAAISISAAVVIAIATVVFVVNIDGDSNEQAAPATDPSATATSSATPSSTTSSSETSSAYVPAPPPIVPGWQAVTVPKRGAAYDVPADWTLATPDNIVGFGEPDDAVTMRGVAEFQKGYCPNSSGSFRAATGMTARKGSSDAEVATATVQKLAGLVYGANGQVPQVAMGPLQPVNQGQIHGVLVTATVTHPAPGPCDPPAGLISILAANNSNDGSVVHIGIADQGVPGALPPETLNTIMTSLRPL